MVIGEGHGPSDHSTLARHRADEEQPGAFRPWDGHDAYPASSLPALIAGKCASRQGEDAFERFHAAVFRAFFHDSRNISDRSLLIALAEEVGLDPGRFAADFDSGRQEAAVMADYQEVRRDYEGWGVPLAIVDDRFPLAGAVPADLYRRVVDLSLARRDA